jgi:DASH complex subunit DAM1
MVHNILTKYADTLEAEEAQQAAEALRRASEPPPPPPEPSIADKTVASTVADDDRPKPKTKMVLVKKGGKKPQMTAKQKRERSLELEKIVSTLPLEFRGSDIVSTLRVRRICFAEAFQDLEKEYGASH